MALRGNSSQSFLRSKELLSFSEIFHDREGNNVLDKCILQEALARDSEGELIRHKANIAKILNKYGVIYRMIFNAMNMAQYTYDEIQEALEHLSEYINDLGVSGIVEFHAADKTQNSDHIHFWISSEDRLIYNKIAKEMVAMGYSNEEDVYIQKYENNEKLDETEYVNSENRTLKDRFAIKPMDRESRETIDSIVDNISNLFKKVSGEKDSTIDKKESSISDIIEKDSIVKDCTLPKTEETNRILSRIEELRERMGKNSAILTIPLKLLQYKKIN